MKIVVDAGHGGWDNGAMYQGRKEKDDNLRLALAVGDALRERGNEVVYTRTRDVYQSPSEKARIGNAAGGDYFVSIHRNSGVIPNQYSGVQTLIYNEGDEKEEIANAINEELEQLGFNNIGISVRKDLAVLRGTTMPAFLVEAGFINSDEDNRIFDEKFDEIAQAIANGIQSVETGRTESDYTYRIQVGLFRNPANAQALAEELRGFGYTADVVWMNGYYGVLVGKFSDYNRAQRIESVLREDGYETIVIAM